MRYAAIALALTIGACAQQQQMDALTYSHEVYIGCLRMKEPAECETQRAAFESNRAYADSVSRRHAADAAQPPLVLKTYTLPTAAPIQPRQINCTTWGNVTNCY